MTTSPITLPSHRARPYTRRQERRALAAALRRRNRARAIDRFTYRYRAPMLILAGLGATVIALTVAVESLRMVGWL